ncbi:MAG: hypothetical protein ACYTFO_06500, partial [Planctomycetota bacterium]
MTGNWIDDSRRARTYAVLSACFFPPDEELLSTLRQLDGSSDAWRDLRQAAEDADLDAMKVDHAQLFVGPFGL